ncbi:PIG-L family deacetylase [Aquincola sp. MAHUQ-54]|uniref:PIG-L family deacetylase n=1 Tax=Aquincola agrisoli TaxID=3119538 RepID=A0AAW9QEP2_9BURK
MDPVAAERAIEGQGTPESAWQRWGGLHAMPQRSAGGLLPPGARAVVLAPHPDDEVLACGGLLAQWVAAGHPVSVVCVTDGEASLPAARGCAPAELAARRRREREAGLRCLGVLGRAELHCLALPDGGVGGCLPALAGRLAALLGPGDQVFAPWRHDGHPDHEAVGEAAARACRRAGATLHELPIWMWHWAAPGDPRVPWARLRRIGVQHRLPKAKAILRHRSQVLPFGGEAPTLPRWALKRWLRPHEYVFEPAP